MKSFLSVKIILLLILGLSFQGPVFAQEKVSRQDRLIGFTFKALAKAFVATADINKLKKDNIAKLNKMDEKKFKKRYIKVYAVINNLPDALKADYGVTEDMDSRHAIKNIESLDKNKLYAIIDSIPDTVIADQFKQYLKQKKQDLQKSNLVVQINKMWNKIIKSLPEN